MLVTRRKIPINGLHLLRRFLPSERLPLVWSLLYVIGLQTLDATAVATFGACVELRRGPMARTVTRQLSAARGRRRGGTVDRWSPVEIARDVQFVDRCAIHRPAHGLASARPLTRIRNLNA